LKPTIPDSNGNVKGNVDGDLILKAIAEINNYKKAIIISSDGDFYSLVAYLRGHHKLEALMSPDERHCSYLLRKAALYKIRFMNNLRNKLARNEKGTA
jgi:uncharacterized LabA/DUF88 family protein